MSTCGVAVCVHEMVMHSVMQPARFLRYMPAGPYAAAHGESSGARTVPYVRSDDVVAAQRRVTSPSVSQWSCVGVHAQASRIPPYIAASVPPIHGVRVTARRCVPYVSCCSVMEDINQASASPRPLRLSIPGAGTDADSELVVRTDDSHPEHVGVHIWTRDSDDQRTGVGIVVTRADFSALARAFGQHHA